MDRSLLIPASKTLLMHSASQSNQGYYYYYYYYHHCYIFLSHSAFLISQRYHSLVSEMEKTGSVLP